MRILLCINSSRGVISVTSEKYRRSLSMQLFPQRLHQTSPSHNENKMKPYKPQSLTKETIPEKINV